MPNSFYWSLAGVLARWMMKGNPAQHGQLPPIPTVAQHRCHLVREIPRPRRKVAGMIQLDPERLDYRRLVRSQTL